MSHSREYDREYHRKYRASHPEKMAEYNRTQMERRRARRVVRQGVCALCGKTFEVGIGKRMTKYCSHKCMKREGTLRQLAKEAAKREAEAMQVLRHEVTVRSMATTVPPPASGAAGNSGLVTRPSAVSLCSAVPPVAGGGTVHALLKRPCAFCGAEMLVDPSHANKKYCSKRCRDLGCKYPNKAAYELAKSERQARRQAERLAARRQRDSFGLTLEQRLAVITAQDGDRDALWKASQSWTPEQRKFAKARWEAIHPTHQEFVWGRY